MKWCSNLFSYSDSQLSSGEELVEEIFRRPDVRIERIISTGQVSGWYDQKEAEWVCLVQGKAQLEYEGGQTQDLTAGDIVFLPAHKKHRVSATSRQPACIWLCVFFPGD